MPAAAAGTGSVHASLMGFRGGGPAAKKQRRTALVVIDGDDATTANHDDVRRWRQIVMAAQGRPWADEEFPAVQLSIEWLMPERLKGSVHGGHFWIATNQRFAPDRLCRWRF